MTTPTCTRAQVLRFRLLQHQLHRAPGSAGGPTDVDLLPFGVQDTGTDGASWALAIRGVPAVDPGEIAFAWTLRGAPHAYPRADLAWVAVAAAPWSEADAAKRIFDAARPLRVARIPALEGLRVVAGHLRDIVAKPTGKGEASARLTERLDPPYLRSCRPCNAIHCYEMPFRLAALHAGLELDPGTSPPVLRRAPGLQPPRYRRLAGDAPARFDVIRACLRFYGPARVGDVATFLDAPVKDVKAHWPADAVEVAVADEPAVGTPPPRFLLPDDLDALAEAGAGIDEPTVRLVGPYDPYLQLRDRELLVADGARRKDLWPVLGRPGAILADGEVVGTWRPRAAGRRLTVRIEPWTRLAKRDRALVDEQAQRLAAHRGLGDVAVVEE